MKKILGILALASFTLVYTSCETTSFYRQTHTMAQSLHNSKWQMITISGLTSEDLGKSVTLNFDNEKVSGYSGCNNYSATYFLTNNQISIKDILSTKKACMPGMDTENAFFRSLRNTSSYTIEEGHLVLRDNNGNDLAKFVPIR